MERTGLLDDYRESWQSVGLDNNRGLSRLDRALYMDVCTCFGKITMWHAVAREKQNCDDPSLSYTVCRSQIQLHCISFHGYFSRLLYYIVCVCGCVTMPVCVCWERETEFVIVCVYFFITVTPISFCFSDNVYLRKGKLTYQTLWLTKPALPDWPVVHVEQRTANTDSETHVCFLFLSLLFLLPFLSVRLLTGSYLRVDSSASLCMLPHVSLSSHISLLSWECLDM